MSKDAPPGHAFISYVREDSAAVDQLQRVLEDEGIPIWRDTTSLWPGQDLLQMIRRAITDNALVFIACFSSNRADHGSNSQNEELTLAIEELRKRPPDDSWLIPVRLDDCVIPDRSIDGHRRLDTLQRVDLFGEARNAGMARLTAAVSRHLGRPETGGGKSFVDQDRERAMLEDYLAREGPGVIMVHGPPGAGKSVLVTRVLQDMRLRYKPHRLAPGDRLDALQLLESIESKAMPRAGLRLGDDALSRLEVAMERRDGNSAVVVVDSAQHLLKSDADSMIDLGLDEALDVIAGGSRHVKVILIFRELPKPRPASEWSERPAIVSVLGLPRDHFRSHLRNLDHTAQLGLANSSQENLDGLYDILQGIPRLADLFCSVLAQPESRWNASELAQHLVQVPVRRSAAITAQERERLLAHELIDCLSHDQRRIVVALAAFAVPVTITQVRRLLAEELPAAQVTELLPRLVDAGVISKESDRYYLPASAIEGALEQRHDGAALLRHQAANELGDSRIPEEIIREPAELDTHFAELKLRIRAQLWESSYELVERMDPILNRWNASGRLRAFREAMTEQLETSYEEMVNYDALGCIYTSLGLSGEARHAFDKALHNANASERPDYRRKVYVNFARLHRVVGDTAEAVRLYENALAIAEEHEDGRDLIPAWSGLADCSRQWGKYSDAIRYGRLALSVAAQHDPDWTVSIAIRLARWHSELDQQKGAWRLLEQAEQAAAEQRDLALLVQCTDLRADLLLDSGELVEAKETAADAVTRALQLPDPVTVLQARTTLAMACMRLHEIAEANRIIDRATRHRRKGESLIVLALQGLAAFLADRDEEARSLFADLESEAVNRRNRDARDFAAWDFEGLAICATRLGRPGSLVPAVEKFERARRQAAPSPVLEARLRFMLGILQTKATPGQLDQAMAAATRAKMTQDHA